MGYDAAQALSDVMVELGIAIDGGKDSLSMAARVPLTSGGSETAKSPGQLHHSICTCTRRAYQGDTRPEVARRQCAVVRGFRNWVTYIGRVSIGTSPWPARCGNSTRSECCRLEGGLRSNPTFAFWRFIAGGPRSFRWRSSCD